MKNNLKRCSGFTLIEVIISMALIAIISMGVYSSYLMIIKTTKSGQVKQSAALAGKKTLEVIKGINSFSKSSGGDIPLRLDDENVVLKYDNSEGKEKYLATTIKLDKDFKVCSNQSNTNTDFVYIQSISLIQTNNEHGKEINIDKNDNAQGSAGTNILKHEFSLEVNENNYSIKDIDNNKTSNLTIVSGTVPIYLLLESKSAGGKIEKEIRIKNSDGTVLLEDPIELGEVLEGQNEKNEVTLNINFSKYRGSNLKDVKIYVYNENEEENCITNIYLQKSQDINVDVKVNEGEAYIHNNRAEEPNYKIGDLYDIKTEIRNKYNETLFTGYSNQNININ